MSPPARRTDQSIKFYGYGSLSPQGQLLIPKELRDEMELPPGKMMVFGDLERVRIIATPEPEAAALLEAVGDLHLRSQARN
jgi:bifunctional DNA-binding transcriptional regulator/antitoxin component of YhaV-PrlF toxin-antitoxin module